jgi:hypothetical protein
LLKESGSNTEILFAKIDLSADFFGSFLHYSLNNFFTKSFIIPSAEGYGSWPSVDAFRLYPRDALPTEARTETRRALPAELSLTTGGI